jgi:hypothetical protein
LSHRSTLQNGKREKVTMFKTTYLVTKRQQKQKSCLLQNNNFSSQVKYIYLAVPGITYAIPEDLKGFISVSWPI